MPTKNPQKKKKHVKVRNNQKSLCFDKIAIFCMALSLLFPPPPHSD